MKPKTSTAQIVCHTIRENPWLSLFLVLTILFSTLLSLLPPLVLEKMVDTLAARESLRLLTAVGYFLLIAASGLLDTARESLITAFGQKVTHQIRSAMSRKLNRLPSAYYIEREPGTTASC